MDIRLLTAQDGPDFQLLRLKALQTNPQAFLATFESESSRHEQSFSQELEMVYGPPVFGYYGIWDDNRLIGFCQLSRGQLTKQQHIASLFNLYIDPAYRGQGLAQQLLTHIMAQLRQHQPEVELVFISCLAKNKPAYQLYRKLGFQRCGIRPRSCRWHGEYDDEVELVKKLTV